MEIKKKDCVIPENIHTSPMEGIFSKTPPPLWKFQINFIHFFKFFGLTEPPTPQEIPIPSVGGVWIFSGTAHFAFSAIVILLIQFYFGSFNILLDYLYLYGSGQLVYMCTLLEDNL